MTLSKTQLEIYFHIFTSLTCTVNKWIFLFNIVFLSAVVLNPPCVPQNMIKRFFSSIGKSSNFLTTHLFESFKQNNSLSMQLLLQTF